MYVTDANLTSGYVFVDTIKPNLTINGNETIIVELYSEYIDQGANVTDEDPAYNYTITSNTSAVNSRIPGTYLIEYMAQPDPAGNIPETATRTVSVTDTKIPYLEMLNITSDKQHTCTITLRFQLSSGHICSCKCLICLKCDCQNVIYGGTCVVCIITCDV